MGVRLYNPVRGAFTTVDPVAGGNTTAYAYPQDPINKVDLDGKAKKKKKKVNYGLLAAAIFNIFYGSYKVLKGIKVARSIALCGMIGIGGVIYCAGYSIYSIPVGASRAWRGTKQLNAFKKNPYCAPGKCGNQAQAIRFLRGVLPRLGGKWYEFVGGWI